MLKLRIAYIDEKTECLNNDIKKGKCKCNQSEVATEELRLAASPLSPRPARILFVPRMMCSTSISFFQDGEQSAKRARQNCHHRPAGRPIDVVVVPMHLSPACSRDTIPIWITIRPHPSTPKDDPSTSSMDSSSSPRFAFLRVRSSPPFRLSIESPSLA